MKSPKRAEKQLNRHQMIRKALLSEGECHVDDLAGRFGVTSMTIRRDFAEMESAGEVVRTHGGAIINESFVREASFADKSRMRRAQKIAIAAAVTQVLPEQGTLYLDTGTTALEVARALPRGHYYRVCTNNLNAAMVLFGRTDVEVTVLGGTLGRLSPDLSGPISIEQLGKYFFDITILGCDALDLSRSEFYSADNPTAQLTQAVQKRSSRSILAVDSSKIGQHSLFVAGTVNEKMTLITDSEFSRSSSFEMRRKLPCACIIAPPL